MRIPSGRELVYFQPRFELNDKGREQLVYTSPRGTKQLYGGLLTENITQASSRDLLADCLIRMDVLGLDIVMHCHDESVIECDESDDATVSLVDWAMRQVEPWADGMPLGAETHAGIRYTK
jgi:DNA polymerase